MPHPDFYVYLDEYERGQCFVLAGALIPADTASALLADWDALRRSIKGVLLEDYPWAREHPFLQGKRLPEIHAVDLFQSQNYYRKYRRGNEVGGDRYWLQHYTWLEQALLIIQHHRIKFVAFAIDNTALLDRTARGHPPVSDDFRFLESDILRSEVERLYKLPYVHALPVMMLQLNSLLTSMGVKGELICDDHEMSKGFEVLESIEWLREDGHYTSLSAPSFASGLDETLLQVTDVLCYVAGSKFHAEATQRRLKEPLARWWNLYVDEALIVTPPLTSVQGRQVNLMVLELVLRQVVHDEELKAQLGTVLRKISTEMFGKL